MCSACINANVELARVYLRISGIFRLLDPLVLQCHIRNRCFISIEKSRGPRPGESALVRGAEDAEEGVISGESGNTDSPEASRAFGQNSNP
jgi:hypothetical protein